MIKKEFNLVKDFKEGDIIVTNGSLNETINTNPYLLIGKIGLIKHNRIFIFQNFKDGCVYSITEKIKTKLKKSKYKYCWIIYQNNKKCYFEKAKINEIDYTNICCL